MSWPTAPLGTVAETALGKMLDRSMTRGHPSVPYLRNQNVQWGRIDTSDVLTMELADEERDRFGVRPGDLLVCEGGEIGRAAIYEGGDAFMAFQKALHRVRPSSTLSPLFLRYYLESAASSGVLARFSTGSTIAHLPQERLRRIPVPLPPTDEQRQIVEIIEDHLSRLETGVGYIDKNLMRASLMRRSAWERRFASGSKLVPMASLVDKTEAGKSVGGAAPAARPGRWGIIKVSAMTRGEFRPQENKEVPDALADERFRIRLGDLLVSRANTSELVGASVLVQVSPERLLLSDKSVRVVPRSDVLAEWLWRALSAPSTRMQISAKATGTKDSMRNISQQGLLDLMVPDPSARDQAADIQWARELDMGVTRLEDQLGAQRGRASSLRRAVLAAAFSGRLTGTASDSDLIEETADTLEGER